MGSKPARWSPYVPWWCIRSMGPTFAHVLPLWWVIVFRDVTMPWFFWARKRSCKLIWNISLKDNKYKYKSKCYSYVLDVSHSVPHGAWWAKTAHVHCESCIANTLLLVYFCEFRLIAHRLSSMTRLWFYLSIINTCHSSVTPTLLTLCHPLLIRTRRRRPLHLHSRSPME